jgi:hypothetical protein
MRSGGHVQLAALRNRDLEIRQPCHLVIMDQWNGQQRAVAIKMFYMFGFLQFLLGFSKVPIFLYHLVYIYIYNFSILVDKLELNQHRLKGL